MDYKASCEELESLGFCMLHSVRSIRHYQFKYSRSDQNYPLSEFSLWHHPAGIVLVVESGSLGKDHLVVSSMKCHFQADLGAGSEFAIIGAVRIRSSGTTILQMDGTSRKVGSVSVSPGQESLIESLTGIQKHARLVPLEGWIGEDLFHIPPEFMLPVSEPGPWMGKDMEEELRKRPEIANPHIQDMKRALPNRLWELIEPSILPGNKLPNTAHAATEQSKEHCLRNDWMAVEYSLRKISEGLFLTRQRFPGKEVREHVEHWMKVALGKLGEEVSGWRAEGPGPAGMSLATALLYTISEPSHERLLRLIQERPVEEVQEWCTNPDGAGFVLGQRLIDRAFINTSVEDRDVLEKQLLEVYDALVEKVGLENIRLITPLRSALGVWIENTAGKSDHALSSMAWRREVASKLMLKMVGDGLEWNGPLNWRTYPHVVDSTQDNRPRFMTMGPDPVSHPQWIALTGDNVRGTGLLSALVEADMDRSIPTLEDLDPPSRPKSRF